MLFRFQRLVARCSLQRVSNAVTLPHFANAKSPAARSAICFVQLPSFAKEFSPSLSSLRARPLSSVTQRSELHSDASGGSPNAQVEPPAPRAPTDAPASAPAPPANIFVRTSLVGASVGLLTPLYVAAGIGWIWQFYKPQTFLGQAAKFAVGGIFLGAAWVNGWTMFTQHVLPFLFNHAEIVLPFALANAAVAAAWYAVGESVFGLERMSGHTTMFNAFRHFLPGNSAAAAPTGLPLGGPLVGILTALTSFPLWAPLSERVWPQQLLDACDVSVLANVYLNFLPVGLGTGALVGLGLHFALAPVFAGRIHSAGGGSVLYSLLLFVLAATLAYFYSCRFDYSAWEQRLDADSGCLVWAHAASGVKAAAPERLLNDTLWLLKAVALFCNLNSVSSQSHFCFVNKRLLADALVAGAKLSSCSHGSPSISDAFEQSKLLLHIYYGLNIKDLDHLIGQLLRVQHDLRMAESLDESAGKADAVDRAARSKQLLLSKIRALGGNADAATAIDHLLSDLPSLECKLREEAGLDFSKGSGTVSKLVASLRSLAPSPSHGSGQMWSQKRVAVAVFALGGILLYAMMR
jgi:hypothetical protein